MNAMNARETRIICAAHELLTRNRTEESGEDSCAVLAEELLLAVTNPAAFRALMLDKEAGPIVRGHLRPECSEDVYIDLHIIFQKAGRAAQSTLAEA